MKNFVTLCLTSCVAFTLGCFARLAFDFGVAAREAARQAQADAESAAEVAASGTSEAGVQKDIADFKVQAQGKVPQKVGVIDSKRPAILNLTNRDCMNFSGVWVPKLSDAEWDYLTNFFMTTNVPLIRMVDNTKASE